MARPLLIRLPNWLGDLIQALPVLNAAARDPSRPTLFLGPAAFEPLLTPRFPGIPYIAWSRERRFAAAGAIRRHRPGSALLLTDSLSSAILVALSGVPERVGYAAEFRDPLLTRRVPRPTPSRSGPRVEEYAVLARAAGLEVTETLPRIRALEEERAQAEALLLERGVGAGPLAVLAPGASYGPAKRWDPESFAQVASALQARARPVLVGTKGDAGPAGGVARILGPTAVDLTGSTDLPALVGILDRSVLAVSNDSGVMHLAAALGTPTVAVFGSTSPIWSSAEAPWVRALYAAYPCSPCFRRTCPIDLRCLTQIRVSDVVAAVLKLA